MCRDSISRGPTSRRKSGFSRAVNATASTWPSCSGADQTSCCSTNRQTTLMSIHCGHSKKQSPILPVVRWSSATTAGSSTGWRHTSWPSKATATSTGARATSKPTKNSASSEWAKPPTNRSDSGIKNCSTVDERIEDAGVREKTSVSAPLPPHSCILHPDVDKLENCEEHQTQ